MPKGFDAPPIKLFAVQLAEGFAFFETPQAAADFVIKAKGQGARVRVFSCDPVWVAETRESLGLSTPANGG